MWNTPKNTNHQRSFTLSLNCLNLVRSVQAFYLKFRGMDLNSAEQIFPKSTHFYKTAPFCSFKKDGMGMAQLPSTVFFLVEFIRQNWKKRPETRFIIQLATRRRHLKSWWHQVGVLPDGSTVHFHGLLASFCYTVGGQNPTNWAPGW